MDYITSEQKTIEVCDVDYKGEYQICHILERFTQIATKNAEILHMWDKDMYGKYGWVVAKQTLTLQQPILLSDTIELSTMVGKGSFVAFPRYYFIHKDGQQIGQCTSIWTLIDIQNRRIVSPKKVGINIIDVTHQVSLDAPKTIQKDIPLEYITTRQVLYSDVDTNQHMNNTRYVQWALDLIDYQIHQECYLKEISINYKKEIRPLEYVKLYLGQQDYRFVVEGRDKEENVYFMIEVYFDYR